MASAQKRPKRDENETIDGYIRHARKTEIYGRCLFQARPTLQLPRLGKEKVSSCAFI